jgi:hypothetical protein
VWKQGRRRERRNVVSGRFSRSNSVELHWRVSEKQKPAHFLLVLLAYVTRRRNAKAPADFRVPLHLAHRKEAP